MIQSSLWIKISWWILRIGILFKWSNYRICLKVNLKNQECHCVDKLTSVFLIMNMILMSYPLMYGIEKYFDGTGCLFLQEILL